MPDTTYQEFFLSGVLTECCIEYKFEFLKKLDLNSLLQGEQPNSTTGRKCLILNQTTKTELHRLTEHFAESIRFYFDDQFEKFKSVVGFVTVNDGSISHNGVENHIDDCDYTFNIALNSEYEGGELHFKNCGDMVDNKFKNLTKNCTDFNVDIKPNPYTIVIHRGKIEHSVSPVTKGTRYNIVLWCYENQVVNIGDEFQIV